MMIIDLPAVRQAVRFPLSNPTVVVAGAALYALVFAFQSYFTALAGAGDAGAAPLGLLLGLVALVAFVLAMASWGRVALGKPSGPWPGLALGGDEGRLAWATVLILILSLTVLGTAFLAVTFMIAALALINVDPNAPAPEGDVDLFAMFGTGEMITAGVIFTVFALFSLWFFLRLAMAYPATLDAGRIQIMSIWPLSGRGRSVQILTTVLASALPGVAILALFNLAAAGVAGVYPASAQSASGELGALSVSVPVFLALAFVYGLGKAALVGAPVCVALCTLYQSLRATPAQ
jgi:hypothetical protein